MRDFGWLGRSGKASYDVNAPATPITGIPAYMQPEVFLRYGVDHVTLGNITYIGGEQAARYDISPQKLHRSGRT